LETWQHDKTVFRTVPHITTLAHKGHPVALHLFSPLKNNNDTSKKAADGDSLTTSFKVTVKLLVDLSTMTQILSVTIHNWHLLIRSTHAWLTADRRDTVLSQQTHGYFSCDKHVNICIRQLQAFKLKSIWLFMYITNGLRIYTILIYQ